MTANKSVPSFSVQYATSRSEVRSNKLGIREMHERAPEKRRLVVMGQKVNTP
jgi:hypothetical protein